LSLFLALETEASRSSAPTTLYYTLYGAEYSYDTEIFCAELVEDYLYNYMLDMQDWHTGEWSSLLPVLEVARAEIEVLKTSAKAEALYVYMMNLSDWTTGEWSSLLPVLEGLREQADKALVDLATYTAAL